MIDEPNENPQVAAIRARKAKFIAAGICPSCEGHKELRVTRYSMNGTRMRRVTTMEPCDQCAGSGISAKDREVIP